MTKDGQRYEWSNDEEAAAAWKAMKNAEPFSSRIPAAIAKAERILAGFEHAVIDDGGKPRVCLTATEVALAKALEDDEQCLVYRVLKGGHERRFRETGETFTDAELFTCVKLSEPGRCARCAALIAFAEKVESL